MPNNILRAEWPGNETTSLTYVNTVMGLALRAVGQSMRELDADRFRREADECRQLAEKSVSALDKEAWLRLANEWLKLAEGATSRQRRGQERFNRQTMARHERPEGISRTR